METEKSPVIHRAMTDDEKRRYNSDMKKSVASFIGEMATLCHDVHAELPTSEPPKLVEVIPKMWMKETAQTLEAIRLLYEKDFSVQSLTLCRSLLEIFYATLWLFENFLTSKTDPKTSSEVRAKLLELKTYSKFAEWAGKSDPQQFEDIKKTPVGQASAESRRLTRDVLVNRLKVFSSESDLDKAVNAIKSYPKPEDETLKAVGWKYLELYARVSSAVHVKDLGSRQPDKLNESDVLLSTEEMLLTLNGIYIIVKTTTSALGISLPESIESRMKALDERHQTLLFIMPDDEG